MVISPETRMVCILVSVIDIHYVTPIFFLRFSSTKSIVFSVIFGLSDGAFCDFSICKVF